LKNKNILQNICAISPEGNIAHYDNSIVASDALGFPRHRIENLVRSGKPGYSGSVKGWKFTSYQS
jgi:hypothetical protein